MPVPAPIRKEILLALEKSIIPALWSRQVPLGVVVPPFAFPAGIEARLLEETVPRPDSEIPEYPLETRWVQHRLHSSFLPYVGFLYEGCADERTIVSQAQSAKYDLAGGIYAVRWQAPGVLLFPPGAPRNGGDVDFWQSDEPQPPIRILWMSLWNEVLLHTHHKAPGGPREISHSLQINDRQTVALAGAFVEEMKTTTARDQDTARAILLAMLLRIQNQLRTGHPKIANTARSPLPHPDALPPADPGARICRDAAIYIQMRLHEPLSLPRIAQAVGFSPAHLNRLFRRFYGVTVMHHVRQQRISAARRLLEAGPENIAEIATLVGFKRATAFSDIFRRETGLSPSQFRRATRSKSTFGQDDDRNSE